MNREMIIAGVMITCAERAEMLKATLTNLRESEPNLVLVVHHDEGESARPQTRQEINSLKALTVGLNRFPEANVFLFFEDDLVFNRHLIHNLRRWAPLRNYVGARPGQPQPSVREHFFGSLYDPGVRELSANPSQNFFIADPETVFGSQALVMSRATAEYFVAHWWKQEGMQDIKMSRLAANGLNLPIYYHHPSLVQHVGVKGTWANFRFHDTKTFDREFRA